MPLQNAPDTLYLTSASQFSGKNRPHSVKAMRQLLQASAWPGVLTSADFHVTQTAAPSMSVSAAGGQAIVAGTEATDQGFYRVYSDGADTVGPFDPAPTTPGWSRLDLLCIAINDSDYSYAGAPPDGPVWSITKGVAAASPAVPSPPLNALPVAVITIAFGQTTIVDANIDDVRVLSAPHIVLVTASGSQNDSGGTDVQLALDTVVYDSLAPAAPVPGYVGLFNTALKRFICQQPGFYLVTGSVEFGRFNAGDHIFKLFKNGALYREIGRASVVNTGGNDRVTASARVQCAAGDHLELAYNTPGATANAVGGEWAEFAFDRAA